MKRRKFIVTTGVSAVALSLTPLASFGSSLWSIDQTISLPQTASQIRHGMLSPGMSSFVQIDKVLKIFGKQIFFKNGINKGKADLLNFSFEICDEGHCITWIGEKVFKDDIELKVLPDKKLNIIEKYDRTIFLVQGTDLTIQKERINGQLIPITGDIFLNRKTLEQDVVVELNETVNLSASGEYKFIIIEKH